MRRQDLQGFGLMRNRPPTGTSKKAEVVECRVCNTRNCSSVRRMWWANRHEPSELSRRKAQVEMKDNGQKHAALMAEAELDMDISGFAWRRRNKTQQCFPVKCVSTWIRLSSGADLARQQLLLLQTGSRKTCGRQHQPASVTPVQEEHRRGAASLEIGPPCF